MTTTKPQAADGSRARPAPPVGRLACGLSALALAAIPVLVAVEEDAPVALVLLLVAVPPLVLAVWPPPAPLFRALTGSAGLALLAVAVLSFFFGGLALAPSAVLLLVAAVSPSVDAPGRVRVPFALLVAAAVVLLVLLLGS